MILIDTNILSELMKPDPNGHVVSWMDSLQLSEAGIPSVSVAEILYGICSLAEGRRKQRLLEAARTMLEEDFKGRVFSFDEHAAAEYVYIVIQRERYGNPISMPDAQIAAICRVAHSSLATRNIKDFEGTGVELINPFEGR